MKPLTIKFNTWTMKVSKTKAVATNSDGEQAEVHKSPNFESTLRLIRNKCLRNDEAGE